MTGYAAIFSHDEPGYRHPVVTWNEKGQALIFDHHGQLVVASEQPGFKFVLSSDL